MEAILKWIIGGLVTGAVFWWLARSRLTARLAEGEVRYPPAAFIVVVLCVAFFSFCAVMSYGARTGGVGIAAVFAAFAVLGALLLVEFAFTGLSVAGRGLSYRAPLTPSGSVAWGEVEDVRWSPGLQLIILRLRNGRRLRVSLMMAGLPALGAAILENVPHGRIDPVAGQLLTNCASGAPPQPF